MIKGVHYLQMFLAVVASASMTFASSDPQYAAIAHTVGSAAISILTALGLVSGAAGVPAAVPPTVNVSAPVVHIQAPEVHTPAPVVNVSAPVVNVPAPVVNIAMPPAPAPSGAP